MRGKCLDRFFSLPQFFLRFVGQSVRLANDERVQLFFSFIFFFFRSAFPANFEQAAFELC